MPRYVSSHTLACLTRQGAEQLVARLFSSAVVKIRRVQVSMFDGRMLVELEAPDRDALEAWLNTEGLHYDWTMRVELESEAGPLVDAS
jgi:hypothetical protein